MNGGSIAVAIFALFAIILLIPPLVWHSKYRNIPVICLISWFIFFNLKTLINLCIWSGENYQEVWNGVGYCDVMVKLEAATSSGTTSAIAALSLNMYMILRAKNPIFIDEDSKKKNIINLLICVVTPIFVMVTNYFIQSFRYDILRYGGCTPIYIPNISLTIPLLTIWSLLWSLVAIIFSGLALHKFFQKRREVSNILKCTNSNLDFKKFARLLAFNCLVVVALSIMAIYYFISAIRLPGESGEYRDMRDRSKIHYQDTGFSMMGDRIAIIGLSFITFLILGLGSEALEMYKRLL
ncbi:fungal pheromone STE3G-protein-coupled receptor, partial [Suhomyces tanzawaensis NRRL Y-17324]